MSEINRVATLNEILRARAKKKKTGNVNYKKVEWNGIKFASITEKNEYIKFDLLQKAGKIINLRKGETVILVKMGKFIKNGKVSKQEDLKYTPDCEFYAIDLDFHGCKIKGKNVIVEVKSPITAKKVDYRMRRRMFLNTLKKDEVFLEVIVDKKSFKTVLWEVK